MSRESSEKLEELQDAVIGNNQLPMKNRRVATLKSLSEQVSNHTANY